MLRQSYLSTTKLGPHNIVACHYVGAFWHANNNQWRSEFCTPQVSSSIDVHSKQKVGQSESKSGAQLVTMHQKRNIGHNSSTD